MSSTAFYPGKPWRDTEGNLIQAHGGSILEENGTYYWYGENKEFTDGKNGIWTSGVRMYSSQDLYNWKSEGLVLAPTPEDYTSPLHPKRILDRPHILHNRFTGKYVMWMKFAGNEQEPDNWDLQYMGIATAEHITGPYTLQKIIRPCGMESGDFDLWVDERDGKAFVIFGRVHTEVVIADLTEDYLDVTGHYSAHFWNPGPPFAREAPSMFCRNQWYYLLTSGTTGYNPNPTQAARTRLLHGEWQEFGEICQKDTCNNSFAAQYGSVFKVPFKKDLYIALGDRWLASLGEEKAWRFNGDSPVYDSRKLDTGHAGYVWLPVLFDENGTPRLEWRDSWSLDEFEDADPSAHRAQTDPVVPFKKA